MDRKTVKSNLLKSIGYDPATRILEVEFTPKPNKPAKIYQYQDVPPERYAALIADPSLGGYFLAKIKPEFACIRIEENDEEKEETQPPPQAA